MELLIQNNHNNLSFFSMKINMIIYISLIIEIRYFIIAKYIFKIEKPGYIIY